MTAGLVLAGGAGRRYGRPKATVLWDGTMLVERAVDALRAVCDEVVVVGRVEVPLPPMTVPVVHDRRGPDCPLNAVATGLAVLAGHDVVVLACDLPGAAPVVARLAVASSGAVVAVDPDGRIQPLCARYPRRAALALADRLLSEGEHRMLRLAEGLAARPFAASTSELENLNHPR